MRKDLASKYLTELNKIAKDMDVENICSVALENPDFFNWSGSGRSNSHHFGDHGLITHTYEVVVTSLQMASFYNKDNSIDKRELFVSALYHDIGKLWDYERCDTFGWKKTEHNRNIGHLSRSLIIWNNTSYSFGADKELTDAVSHNILSHHCLKDWGSPVLPNSKEAWILHLCDNMSARTYDCSTLDLTKGK